MWTRSLAQFARWFGPQFVLPTINAMEQVDSHSYDAQKDAHATQLPAEERSYARLLEAIVSPTNAREELGIDPDELGGSPWAAAITSFFLFAIGAIV